MEKSADLEYSVTNRHGKLVLRLPGGNEMPYDDRFGKIDYLNDGEYKIFPKENE